ncbi:MAG: glycosyltransferase family 9 protein [Goleter apudmare HA4340-LM2]|jgi:ADP-heptose:LPS heptosyltransferase|nr:glycosyltransferase family 9 protein [Goleter apudmare HA4340-LM2]
MTILTPVSLFIFNRPDLTEKVFAAIAQVKPKKLLVIADGPRFKEEEEKCLKTREVIKAVDWDCEVLTNFSEINLGCKHRVASGLDWVFSQVNEAIILEDDCLPAQSFFYFCQTLLEKYRDDERIMHIAGTNHQDGQKRTEYSYFFSKIPHIWGWATWKRAWQHYDLHMKSWQDFKNSGLMKLVTEDIYEERYWTGIFDLMTSENAINTWDYMWGYACLSQNGLAILPSSNLISNIGFREDATNTKGTSSLANLPIEDIYDIKHPPFIVRNKIADQYTFDFEYGGMHMRKQDNFWFKVWQQFLILKHLIKKAILSFFMSKITAKPIFLLLIFFKQQNFMFFHDLSKYWARQILDWLASPRVTKFHGELFFRLISRRKNNYQKFVSQQINLTKIEKVLVVQLDAIGDVVISTPFLRELRRNLPHAWITLIVQPSVVNLVELCPYVNEVLTYKLIYGRFSRLRNRWREIKFARQYLWSKYFDFAIIPRCGIDFYNATFLAYFSGASLRVGYSEKLNQQKQELNQDYDYLFTHFVAIAEVKHEVERNLDVIKFLGGKVEDDFLECWTSPEDIAFASQVLSINNIDDDHNLVVFAPGASARKRMWPIANFIELGIWLQQEYSLRILAIGGTGEEKLGLELENALGNSVINVIGKTTLRQTLALIKSSRLVVSNDSSPIHFASACRVPVVEISCHPQSGLPEHENSPKRFSPWGVPNIVLQPQALSHSCQECCTYDEPHCIMNISVEEVKKAVATLYCQQKPDFLKKLGC